MHTYKNKVWFIACLCKFFGPWPMGFPYFTTEAIILRAKYFYLGISLEDISYGRIHINTYKWAFFYSIVIRITPSYLNIIKSELYIYNFNICIRNRFFVRYLFVGTELELIYLRWQITYLSDPTQYKK